MRIQVSQGLIHSLHTVFRLPCLQDGADLANFALSNQTKELRSTTWVTNRMHASQNIMKPRGNRKNTHRIQEWG